MKKTILLGIIALVFGIWGLNSTVFGNPSTIPTHSNCLSAVASTTRAWIAPGMATSTLTCDSYNLDPNLPQGTLTDSMVLLLQLTSSTTALSRMVNVAYEVSMDNIDWYPVLLSASTITFGQTDIHLASSTGTYIWFPSGTTASTTFAQIPVPDITTRYIRSKVSIPIGSSNGGIWQEFIPKKETK